MVPALGLPATPLPPVLPDVARIAVLRANGVGDHVVAEPALSALRAAYPRAEITLLGAAHTRPLVEDRPGPCDLNDSGPRHLAAAVGTPTVAVFTNANLADVAPLARTWHRLAVSWQSACQVCGTRVLGGSCPCGASATWDVPEGEVRALALELWEQAEAAGRLDRDVTPVPEVGAA